MKKCLAFFLVIVMAALFAGCGTSENQESSVADSSEAQSVTEAPETMEAVPEETEPSSSEISVVSQEETSEETFGTEEGTGSNILVAYFSWADNAVLAEDVDAVASPSVIPPGNVQQLAGWVQEKTGGDLFSIRVTDPYPSDWDDCLSRANQERGEDARPALAENVAGLEQYDIVFLGYPNWWYGVPMALLTFLEENDLSGKQVYLFCSHGTGGLANSVGRITEAASGADISDNIFDCFEEDTASSEEEIRGWVSELGFSADSAGDESVESEEPDMEVSDMEQRQISVQFGGYTVIYELNDGTAAASLYEQLPITVEVEDYSTNEKIFYPDQALDTSGAPLAAAGAGTLAYYEPWGDVVFFYGDYSENPSLFELGQVVSGGEHISEMSGTITIEAAE